MGQRRLVVEARLLVEMAKGPPSDGRTFSVTNPLPADVEIVRYQQQPSRYGAMSSSVLWVVLQSASWEGDQLGAGQELEALDFTVDYGADGIDEQEEPTEHLALKAALAKQVKLTQELKDDQILGRATEPQEESDADTPMPDTEEPDGAEEPESEPSEQVPVPAGQTGPRGTRVVARATQ